MEITKYMVKSPKSKRDFIYNREIFIWHNNLHLSIRAHHTSNINKSTRKMEDRLRLLRDGKLAFIVKPKNGIIK